MIAYLIIESSLLGNPYAKSWIGGVDIWDVAVVKLLIEFLEFCETEFPASLIHALLNAFPITFR